MEFRQLGRTGLMVSEIGLGALEIGRDWGIRIGEDYGRPDEKDAIRVLNVALDAGITLIDTAPAYKLSEERIGKAISHRRREYVLATKVGERLNDDDPQSIYDYSYDATLAFIEQSLRRMRTDVIDLIQIHSAPVEVIRKGETLSALKKAQEQGKVRFIGITGSVEAAIEAVRAGHYDSVQVSYNIAYREAEKELFPLTRQHHVGAIIKDGLGRGSLTSKATALPPEKQADIDRAARLERECLTDSKHPNAYPKTLAELALRFLLSNDAVTSVIAGTRTADHILANVAASDGRRLSPEQVERVIRVANQL